MKYHCFFEQSGTFKNVFKKLGFQSYDYDILNDFNETDFKIDLFNEIEKAYGGGYSVFDSIEKEDYILAFFPCIRFTANVFLFFRGDAYQLKNKDLIDKLELDLKMHKELSQLYELITKLAIVCLKKDLKLVIENPYNEQHYLKKMWCIKPSVIDNDRYLHGDYYKKPTQYFFVNCEPKHNNTSFKPTIQNVKQNVNDAHIEGCSRKVARSMINPNYAEWFIREYILESDDENGQ